MIKHLKEVYRKLYLPSVPSAPEHKYTVEPVAEPYLYANPSIEIDQFDGLQQAVSIPIYNAGSQPLKVSDLEIEQRAGKWLQKRKTETAGLSNVPTGESLELAVDLRHLPSSATAHTAALHLVSNSCSKAFSTVQLRVRPLDSNAPILKAPSNISFSEISVWKLTVTHTRQNQPTQVDFYLIGDAHGRSPERFHLKQTGERILHACFFTGKSELHYELDLAVPGIAAPQQSKKKGTKSSPASRDLEIVNVGQAVFSGEAEVSEQWMCLSSIDIQIDPVARRHVRLSLNPQAMQPGLNLGWLSIMGSQPNTETEGGQPQRAESPMLRIPVWVWYTIKGNIGSDHDLIIPPDAPGLDYTLEFSEHSEPPPIEVLPDAVHQEEFMLFEDTAFQFPCAATDRNGYLVADFTGWDFRVLKLERGNEVFEAVLSLPDGAYLYRAEVDGEMRLDPFHLNEVICCAHGVACRMALARCEQVATIHNKSDRKLELQLNTSAKWFSVEPASLALLPGGKSDFSIMRKPSQMQLGLNVGYVEAVISNTSLPAIRVPVTAIAKTNGIVLLPRQSEFDLPPLAKGVECTVQLHLDAIGKGELRAELQPSTAFQFAEGDLLVQNQDEFVPQSMMSLIAMRSDKLLIARHSQTRAFLITNCYLANRRMFPLTYRYQVTSLVVDPPTLYFPRVFLFDRPQSAVLTVKRSDGQAVSPVVDIPEALSQTGILTSKPDATNQGRYELTLDPRSAVTSGTLTGMIRLHDSASGMIESVRFAAELLASTSAIQVDAPARLLDPVQNGIQLSISNIGNVDLKIYKLRFRYNRYYCVPHLPRDTVLSPNETIELLLMVNRKAQLLRNIRVRDTIMIQLSDGQYPSGCWQRELEVSIPSRLLRCLEVWRFKSRD